MVGAQGRVGGRESCNGLHVLQLHAAAVEASDGHCRQHGFTIMPAGLGGCGRTGALQLVADVEHVATGIPNSVTRTSGGGQLGEG